MARIEATTVRARGHGLLIQDFPKTAGRRTIALPGWVIDLLDRRRQHQLVTSGDAVVLPSPNGRLSDPHNTSRDLRTVLDRADFAWVTSLV